MLVRGAGVTDPEILCAAVLHDVVEDTDRTVDDVRAAFGPRVAELVGWVTIPEPGPGQDKASVKEEYLRGLRHAPRDAILVKLADRASNAQTLRNLPEARRRAYYAQTVEYIVPLAADEPWFADWYAGWAAAFADLAAPEPGGSRPRRGAEPGDRQPGQQARRVEEVAEPRRRGQHEHQAEPDDQAPGGGRDRARWPDDQRHDDAEAGQGEQGHRDEVPGMPGLDQQPARAAG